ncbi:MAG TPA: DNA-binding response regulator [Clostridiales bacterium]|jgi:two-component system alkaline phosphatase synthesis response regulator PhoP|nr:DNA-binding response regulator [Clostridiales bacterium]MBD8946161.1 DNA-binding response regulator [Clostridiales bacterium]HBL82214.1 DNA-binding response regulator [Clostridiales bacterium]
MQDIFCVEDDADIKELIEYTLSSSGFWVTGFDSAAAFWEGMKTKTPSLVLLDIMLPDEDGMQILKKLKASGKTASIPTIMLTAKSGQIDKIKALDGGADDYVTKPFDIPELISRINAVLRRSAKKTTAGVLKLGNITVDSNSRRVTVGENEVTLTYKEFELLSQLIRNKGLVMTRDKLMVSVWGTDFKGESRTVDVHIRTLRQKLGAAGSCIETVRNVGYKVD